MVTPTLLKVKRSAQHARLPERAHNTDLGYDLFAIGRRSLVDGIYHGSFLTLLPGRITKVDLGIIIEFPEGYGGIVKDRSSMASQGVITVAGVIDEGYRGQMAVMLLNTTDMPYTIQPGDKIAQLILIPTPNIDVVEVEEVSHTQRNDAGFGSTGR